MSKHIIVSNEAHKDFKELAKSSGMRFDGLLKEMIKDQYKKFTGIKDISNMAFKPNRTGKIVGDNNIMYEVTGEHTSWHINCDVCGKEVDNSTEIDIYTNRIKDRARLNPCHYCTNTHVIPTLQSTQVDGNIAPQQLADYIVEKYKKEK